MSETLMQWQYRWWDVSMRGANNSGVATSLVRDTLRALGVPEFPLGTGLVVRDPVTRDALPDGSVITVGDPAQPLTFGVFVRQNRRWTFVLGEYRYLNNDSPPTIDTISGETVRQDWIEAEPTEEDARAIRAFKAKAWPVVAAIKREHGWCSVFDSIMSEAELDSSALEMAEFNGVAVGDDVRMSQAASLPEGTVLRWQRDGVGEVWMRRVDTAANGARTRHLFGWFEDGSAADGINQAALMRVLGFPSNAGLSISVTNADMARYWEHLPVGTVFALGSNPQRYAICRNPDRRAREWYGVDTGYDPLVYDGQYRCRDFGRIGFRILSFPMEQP